MSEILDEITPLTDKDCFYVAERHKSEFNFPIHRHEEYELNFIEHGQGAQRVVGDSVRTIGEYDLVLVGGSELEHAWLQSECKSKDIREITIQFSNKFLSSELLAKNQFAPIGKMLAEAEHGLAFSMSAIMKVYPLLDSLASQTDGFQQCLQFLSILNSLAKDPSSESLASSSFAHAERNMESRRVSKIKQFINDHYSEDLKQTELAAMVNMSPSAFSRFFKLRTGKTLSDYITDIRLGNAARALVDTTKNISEICYDCGFNNLSNFNRLFKAKRSYTPREFRSLFKKQNVVV